MSKFDKVQLIVIDEDHHGQRIDNFLFTQLKGVPKSRVYRILRKGEVRVNKKRTKADYKLCQGDQLRLPPIRVSQNEVSLDIAKLDKVRDLESLIIHETNQFILLNKPSGIAVHGGSGLSFGIIEALRALRPKEKFLELVHRLDKDTSGCLLIAKRRSYLNHFQDQLRHRSMKKEYVAIVVGQWDEANYKIKAPLKKNQAVGGERYVTVDQEGKPSETLFKCLKQFEQLAFIQASPKTGRTHQIRVHAKYAGNPLLGDEKYSDIEASKSLIKSLGLKSFLLHAHKLSFTTPESEDLLTFEAPLPKTMQRTIQFLTNEKNQLR